MVSFFIHAFVSIFVILYPIGNLSVRLGLAHIKWDTRRIHKAAKAILVVLGALTTLLLLEQLLLLLYNISIEAFTIGCGLCLLVIGCKLLQGKTSSRSKQKTIFATVASQGAAGATMCLTENQNHRWFYVPITFLAFVSVLVLSLVPLLVANWLRGRTGQKGLSLVKRATGVALTVIAIEMVVMGFADILPSFEQEAA
ncbi:integral inner membrane protein [Niallia circulans]|jgi:multiple antibiotic resistance protein|uniref:UPF0056 membrane protein n=1 Tax=Shouchella clausii TaxID=79880 RepID=A0A268S088_SHOCL|nr:MarC family protein [Shouchella clausii]PAD41893.1 hypothetical protein CHH54_15245 [Bacillus sp. 7520-S]SPU21388.1 integral inner membrane protein [Niallia circulans]AST97778.1 hypothetical protein BC8716_18175 [Shouchella clausii]MBU8595120.1 hypothetical protein [Shouchella clausii]MCM3548941.1 hypothetical protein [Shouchella clausii]